MKNQQLTKEISFKKLDKKNLKKYGLNYETESIYLEWKNGIATPRQLIEAAKKYATNTFSKKVKKVDFPFVASNKFLLRLILN